MEWFYTYVLGIKLNEDGRVVIRPSLSKELGFARGEYCSAKGKIFVEWSHQVCDYRVEITADEGVDCVVDFTGYEIISMEKDGNHWIAVVK